MKDKRNPHPGKPPDREISQDGGDLKASEKSAAAGLRRGKQREGHTDDEYHLPGHHSLRCSESGWALRLRLWWSVLGRGWLYGDSLRG